MNRVIHLEPVPVREARDILGVDRYDFGYLFGVSMETVSKWEGMYEYPPMAYRVLIGIIVSAGTEKKDRMKALVTPIGIEQKEFETRLIDILGGV